MRDDRGVIKSAPRQDRSFTPYALSKAEGEEVLFAADGKRPGFENIAIRPPMIWRKGMPSARSHGRDCTGRVLAMAGGGEQSMSALHIDNLVDALILAADHGEGGETYFVADAEEGTLQDLGGQEGRTDGRIWVVRDRGGMGTSRNGTPRVCQSASGPL